MQSYGFAERLFNFEKKKDFILKNQGKSKSNKSQKAEKSNSNKCQEAEETLGQQESKLKEICGNCDKKLEKLLLIETLKNRKLLICVCDCKVVIEEITTIHKQREITTIHKQQPSAPIHKQQLTQKQQQPSPPIHARSINESSGTKLLDPISTELINLDLDENDENPSDKVPKSTKEPFAKSVPKSTKEPFAKSTNSFISLFDAPTFTVESFSAPLTSPIIKDKPNNESIKDLLAKRKKVQVKETVKQMKKNQVRRSNSLKKNQVRSNSLKTRDFMQEELWVNFMQEELWVKENVEKIYSIEWYNIDETQQDGNDDHAQDLLKQYVMENPSDAYLMDKDALGIASKVLDSTNPLEESEEYEGNPEKAFMAFQDLVIGLETRQAIVRYGGNPVWVSNQPECIICTHCKVALKEQDIYPLDNDADNDQDESGFIMMIMPYLWTLYTEMGITSKLDWSCIYIFSCPNCQEFFSLSQAE